MNFLNPKAYLISTNSVDEPWIVLTSRNKSRKASGKIRSTGALILMGVFVFGIALPISAYNILSARTSAALLSTAQQGAALQTATFSLPKTDPLITSPTAALNGTKAAISTSVIATSSNNEIRIGDINVKMPIVEGTDDSALYRGAWRSPWGSDPTRGGNTVIFGHRFLNLPPSQETFFRLNEVEVGDIIEIDWEGETYTYRVSESKIVPPSDLSVLNQTNEPRITLITCTPIFSTKNRLIIIAVPI